MILKPAGLLADDLAVFEVSHMGATGRLVLQMYAEDGVECCGIYDFIGEIPAPPKQWLRIVRSGMDELIGHLKAAGVQELRMCGRDWSRIFPDCEPLPGKTNGLRKVL